MQPDPIGYYDSTNLYIYCLNNPVNWLDSWGLSAGKTAPPVLGRSDREVLIRIEMEDMIRKAREWNKKSPGYFWYFNDCGKQADGLQNCINPRTYWTAIVWGRSKYKRGFGPFRGNHTIVKIEPGTYAEQCGFEEFTLDPYTRWPWPFKYWFGHRVRKGTPDEFLEEFPYPQKD